MQLLVSNLLDCTPWGRSDGTVEGKDDGNALTTFVGFYNDTTVGEELASSLVIVDGIDNGTNEGLDNGLDEGNDEGRAVGEELDLLLGIVDGDDCINNGYDGWFDEGNNEEVVDGMILGLTDGVSKDF